jgi:hypothetical protein
MFIAALFKQLSHGISSGTHHQVNGQEFYSTMKKNEIMSLAGKWIFITFTYIMFSLKCDIHNIYNFVLKK